jgi:Bacterial archaeo-eukaryotic release factor family 10
MITAETIDRVTRFDGGRLPVVSAYVGLDAHRPDRGSLSTRASSLLHEIRPMTKDHALDREVRLSVRGDVERIEVSLTAERPRQGSVAIFSCSGNGFYEEIELPRRVRDRIVVDTTPWVRPLLAVLDEYHRTCILILDKETARTWEFYQGELNETSVVLDKALRKPDFAGWYGLEEYRVHNKEEELTKKHFRRVATVLDDFYRAGRFELLVVGGHDHEVPVFEEFLPHRLRGSVAGTFTVDPHTATIGDIGASADAVVDHYERNEELRWVAQVFEKAAAGGNAAVGLERCLWAGSVAAVQRLLVQQDATAAGVVCDESGWLAESGETCIICGQPTRRTDDVIDELTQAVIDTSGAVEHVIADTPLRDHVAAADLRYPLPPKPGNQA